MCSVHGVVGHSNDGHRGHLLNSVAGSVLDAETRRGRHQIGTSQPSMGPAHLEGVPKMTMPAQTLMVTKRHRPRYNR
jgi:hypothetical protein